MFDDVTRKIFMVLLLILTGSVAGIFSIGLYFMLMALIGG